MPRKKIFLSEEDKELYRLEYNRKERERKSKNKEYYNKKGREWRNKNKDKTKLYTQTYNSKNRETLAEKARLFRKENKDKAKEANYRWVNKNRNLAYAINKKWRENNRESYLNKRNSNERQKRLDNPLYKLSQNIRISISGCFRRGKDNYIKSNKTEEILGCTILEFIDYILNLYPEKNLKYEDFHKYGYHIDHIIPISSAKTEEEIIKLCHYTNLQPLWWEENLQKSNKTLI